MSAFADFIEAVERATGRQGRRVGPNVRLLCPAHDDHEPSLDVREGEGGRVLAICRSRGCAWEEICRAIGWESRTRSGDERSWTPAGSAIAIYDYVDEDGGLLFQVCRTADKRFLQRRPDPTAEHGYSWNLKGVRRVLYRLPELLAAVASGTVVYVCEGEKDVETLRRLGLVATCNPGGAGKWRDEFTTALEGATVIVVADRDEAGTRHAKRVAAKLAAVVGSVSVVEPAEGKDVTDHLAAGLALDQLVTLVTEPETGSPVEGQGSRTRAAEMLSLAVGAELFHTDLFKAYATVPADGHLETWPVRSKRFKIWLSKCYYDRDGEIPTAAARNDALTVIEGIALHDGPMREVHVRVAQFEGAIYLDLGDSAWSVIEVTPAGWRVTADPPVRFSRSQGMLALPLPEKGGSIELLRPFLNLDDDGWVLFVSWLVACLRPTGPFPVLDLLGEQGSAKSTAARVARALVDPNKAALRTAPRDSRDFVVTTTSSWMAAFDNLSSISDWLSDALCRLSTGGGYATRELYTDAEEVIFDAQRPVLLTGIIELATRSDLLDRSLLITLPTISDQERLPEAVFWARFEKDRPKILGALLDAVSCALRNESTVELPSLPRLADFAVWAVAAAPSLGWPAEEFLTAYETNRGSVHQIAIEENPVGIALLEIGRKGFTGTATELLKKLAGSVGEQAAKERGWPKSARALSGTLRRLAPNLRALGVDVQYERETTGQKRRMIWLIPRVSAANPVTGDTRVTSSDPTLTTGDATGDASGQGTVTQLPLDEGYDGGGDASDASDAGRSPDAPGMYDRD